MIIGSSKMFIVYGKPKGKGRPRFAARGRYVTAYTDESTKEYEEEVARAFKDSKGIKIDGNIKVSITAYYQIPKGTSKKKREQMLLGKIRPQVKPDVDNVAKIILDALNGLAYEDDNQVVDCYASKWYGEIPRVEIKIWSEE